MKRYQQAHRESIAGWNKEYAALHRWVARMECIERLGGVCARCGYKENLLALQFDHIDPSTKSFKIGSVLQGQRRHTGADGSVLKPSLIAELAKCQLLCANCHAIKSGENGDYVRG